MLAALALAFLCCQTDRSSAAGPPPPQRMRLEIKAVHPHDPRAFTQGLVWHGGSLYESTGLYGASSLREVDVETGEVRRRVVLSANFFAEGLALVGDRLVQLTWQEGVAQVWDLASFERAGEHRYEGEGWGLCHDGKRLVMSDGSDRLAVRDPRTFAPVGEIRVTRELVPVEGLNELECVDGAIWANVWQSDDILRIDPATGRVTAVVDAAGLLTPAERAQTDVLNGIAWDPRKKVFYLTGKYWPKLFEVVFVPR